MKQAICDFSKAAPQYIQHDRFCLHKKFPERIISPSGDVKIIPFYIGYW